MSTLCNTQEIRLFHQRKVFRINREVSLYNDKLHFSVLLISKESQGAPFNFIAAIVIPDVPQHSLNYVLINSMTWCSLTSKNVIVGQLV